MNTKKTRDSGYSGTPLARKLGYRAHQRIYLHQVPANYWSLLAAGDALPPADQLILVTDLADAPDFIHIFVTESQVLAEFLPRALAVMQRDGMLWVSWPKRSAKMPSDMSEDHVRELALPLGLVDVKVCAVDATWSALKLVIRKELR